MRTLPTDNSIFSTLFSPLQTDNPEKILQWAIFFIIAVCSMNALLSTIWVSFFGKESPIIFTIYQDIFADTFKVAFSIPSVWQDFSGTNEFRHLPDTVKIYLLGNPYLGADSFPASGEAATSFTNFHIPPAYISVTVAITSLLKAGLRLWPTVLLAYFLYIVSIVGFLKYSTYKDYTNFPSIRVAILVGASYPAIVALQRANFTALYTCMGIIIFLIHAWHSPKISLIPYLLMAYAIAMRPTACIITAILPIKYGMRKSLPGIIILAASSIAIEAVTFIFIHSIYNDYTFINMLRGLGVYKELYTMSTANMATSSSMLNFFHTITPNLDYNIKNTIHIITNISLLAFAFYLYAKKVDSFIWPFILTAIYTLIGPVTAAYHVLVFLAPLLICCFDEQINKQMRNAIVIMSALMLTSKILTVYMHYELQGIMNPTILFFGILYLGVNSLHHQKETGIPKKMSTEGIPSDL